MLDRVVGDAAENVSEVCIGIEAVSFKVFDQAVEGQQLFRRPDGTLNGSFSTCDGNTPKGQ